MKIALLVTDNREHLKKYSLPNPCFGAAPEALLAGMCGYPDIEVHVVSCTREPIAAPEKLGPNLWYHSVLVPKSGWLTTGYQGCIRGVRQKLREIQPDIVHGQGTERDCAVEAICSGYPNVLTIHGNMREIRAFLNAGLFSYHWFAEKLERLALKSTGGVFCNSLHTEKLVAPYARRFWRVPNALRLPFFEPPRSDRPSCSRTILNVAAICGYKRQVEILDFAEQLHHDGIDVEFAFVGSLGTDAYGTAFRERISRAEKAGYGRYLGVMSTNELIDLMDQAGAMIHLSTVESFGLVVAEGLARNLKFFGSRAGGIVDIAAGVDGAELYEPDDWNGLRRGIDAWANKGCQKPQSASQVMAQRYHPVSVTREHCEIYQEVLTCGKRP